MTTILQNGLSAAIGSQFLKHHNQLAFVEYASGNLSLLDMIRPLAGIVSKGSVILKGTWVFDCETGLQSGNLNGPGDIWWEQIDSIQRQMVPVSSASLVNLGKVNFATVTPTVLQAQNYSRTPIPGNNAATNQLITGDVFAIRTNAGNYCKIKIVQYDYNLSIQWVTYKLGSGYHVIGTGYATPEDIVVAADETTAYVTERTGNLLKVDLNNANRAAAVVIASGMQAPHQIYLDEVRQQAYLVEFANSLINPGHLIRIDLLTHQKTILLSGLVNAIGLLVSSDLAYAYISEQTGGGRVSRYNLQDGTRLEIASNLVNPFFLTWFDAAQTAVFVTERTPANRITIVETVPRADSVRQVALNMGSQASSVAMRDNTHLLVCCNSEIDLADLLTGITPATGLFMGIGLVPWNLITAAGRADTTTQPVYPYQFTKDAPFGGSLSLQVNHTLAWLDNVRYYRVRVDGAPRLDTWWDLKLNPVNGKYEIPVQSLPMTVAGKTGCYAVHKPGDWYINTNLGLYMDSSTLSNGLRSFTIDFTNAAGTVLASHTQSVLIDNHHCAAMIEMPRVNGISATTECGMLKFTDRSQHLQIVYVASHPIPEFATFSWRLCKAGKGVVPGVPECNVNGNASLAPFLFDKDVNTLLGVCPSAAYYAAVYVYAKTINGFSRQTQYDASAAVAFALTP